MFYRISVETKTAFKTYKTTSWELKKIYQKLLVFLFLSRSLDGDFLHILMQTKSITDKSCCIS